MGGKTPGNKRGLWITAELYEIAVGVAQVEALHGTPGTMPQHDARERPYARCLDLGLGLGKVVVHLQTEILCAIFRMSGGRLNSPLLTWTEILPPGK